MPAVLKLSFLSYSRRHGEFSGKTHETKRDPWSEVAGIVCDAALSLRTLCLHGEI